MADLVTDPSMDDEEGEDYRGCNDFYLFEGHVYELLIGLYMLAQMT